MAIREANVANLRVGTVLDTGAGHPPGMSKYQTQCLGYTDEPLVQVRWTDTTGYTEGLPKRPTWVWARKVAVLSENGKDYGQ